MRHIYYWYYRKRYSVPCQMEIQEAYNNTEINISEKINYASLAYIDGDSLEDIAYELDVTRERVRQMLFKIVRVSKKVKV